MTPRDNLSDRGIGFQVAGFTMVGILSLAILQLYTGSDHWTYQGFQTAVTRLHWAFILPLAALFNKVRIMFETRRELRERMFEQALQQALQQARQQARQEVREEVLEEVREEVLEEVLEEVRQEVLADLEQHGVAIPPDLASRIFNRPKDES